MEGPTRILDWMQQGPLEALHYRTGRLALKRPVLHSAGVSNPNAILSRDERPRGRRRRRPQMQIGIVIALESIVEPRRFPIVGTFGEMLQKQRQTRPRPIFVLK